MIRTASCQCGQLSVRCDGEAVRISMCHCIACQRRTGAPFSTNSRFRREQLRISGRSSIYKRIADSGDAVRQHFCPACASTLFWELDAFPDLIAVAQGMFGDPSCPPPTIAVWEQFRHGWTGHIAGMLIERFPGTP